MKPWYETSFGNDYMLVYKHRDMEAARKEIERMITLLGLPQGAKVLDIGCGMGRHSVALSDLGFAVTGVDLSDDLLEEARRHDAYGEVEWIHGDMRELPFEDGSFDATVNLFTSFGYFARESDNVGVLRNIRRVLRPGGLCLIDFLNPNYVAEHLVPHSVREDEEEGVRIDEVRTIDGDWVKKEITITELVVKEGKDAKRQYMERVRLYELDWFREHFASSGLELIGVYGNYDGTPYREADSNRLVMIGRAI
ncbi:class I SAM-dependent methyltransferase [Paenibacillus sp. YIM B09110]|uniref:class I SAM-dependent methyltransferase n=1 Tax=Paenibacillus sp. YIM B09110 TaxID=3126102 RepID=UPI00301BDCAB